MIAKITKRNLLICLLAGVVILCLGLGLGFGLQGNANVKKASLGVFKRAAVAANGAECAIIGRNILQKGGSAADSAIATLLCEGVACPQSMGIGGGFLLTIYIKKNGTVETLDARESAPAAAHRDMYENDTSKSKTGGLSVAVPGELRGYWALHQRYGILPWKELFQPVIELCRNGHIVSAYLGNVLKKREHKIKSIASLREVFIDPKTERVYREGDRIRRPKLAATLEAIAQQGPDALYNGTLTKGFIKDISEAGGIITEDDLANYSPRWDLPITVSLPNNLTLHTSPLPGSGILLAYKLRVLKGLLPAKDQVTSWQRIIETYKFAFGSRSNLGDPYFAPGMKEFVEKLSSDKHIESTRRLISDTKTHQNWTYYGGNFSQPDDHGTAHISVLADNGDAVSATSTINYIMGAMFRSSSTGIILNDEMDDFSIPNTDNVYGVPPSPANFIEPGKRPLSSMCPSIITDASGDVRLIIGGAGGTKISTSVAYVTIRHLWYNDSLSAAVQAKRMHHQLFPMAVQHEVGFNDNILNSLSKIGHSLTEIPVDDGFAALTAVSRYNDNIYATYDVRRPGSISGY